MAVESRVVEAGTLQGQIRTAAGIPQENIIDTSIIQKHFTGPFVVENSCFALSVKKTIQSCGDVIVFTEEESESVTPWSILLRKNNYHCVIGKGK